ncbi:2,3-dehydroadipyl-CoA hydratase [bacterium HR40]|nr:2,3-dehydroadipyl-CoA hydratase [bacterium HR40]
MTAEVLVVERPAPQIALLRLNRPEARNALNMALRQALAEAFRALDADPEVRVVVMTGDDRAFAAGADLRELVDAGAAEMMRRATHRLWQAIADFSRPIVAAVRGFALGGGMELALHADIVIAGEGARFGQPEVKVGVMPGAGGTQRLLRAAGRWRAMLLLLTGEIVDAREAQTMGFVSRVVADDQVLPYALDLAARIAAMPPLAVAQIKEVVNLGADAPLATALALERKAFQLLFDTRDQKEGMRAFLEKRPPRFEGK